MDARLRANKDRQTPAPPKPQTQAKGQQDQDQQEMDMATQVVCIKFYTAHTERLPQFHKIKPGSGSANLGSPGSSSSVNARGSGSGCSELGRITFDNVDLKQTSIIEEVYRKGKVATTAEDIRRLRVMSLENYPLPKEAVSSYKNVCYLDISSFVEDLSTVFHLVGKLPALGVLHFHHGSISDMGNRSSMDQGHVDTKPEPLYADSLFANPALMSVDLIINPDKFYKENHRGQRNITDRIYIVLKYVGLVCPNLSRAELAIPFEVDLTTFRRNLPGASVKLIPFMINTVTGEESRTPSPVAAQSTPRAQVQAPSADAAPGDFGNEVRRKKQPLRPAWAPSMRTPRASTESASAPRSGFGTPNVVFPRTPPPLMQRPREGTPATPELIDLDDYDEGENVVFRVGHCRASSHSKQRRTGH